MIAPSRLPEPQTFRLALRADEAADALGLSLRTLMGMVERNEIPHSRIGARNLRFPIAALQRYLDGQTTWPVGMGVVSHEQQADSRDDLTDDMARAAFPAAKWAGSATR